MNTFTMKNWEEHLASGVEGQPRVTYAHATMAYSGVIEGESICDYLLYYAGEGYDGGDTTSPGYERFDGTVFDSAGDGRRDTFVVRHEVGFDPKGIQSKFEVVPGSATGELAGLTGTGSVDGVMGEPAMSYTFDYRL